jgi:hypothetical protein
VGVAVGRDDQGRRVLLVTAHPGGGVLRRVEDGPWLRPPTGPAEPYADPDAIARAEFLWVADTRLVYLFDPRVGVFRSTDAGLGWSLVWAQPSNQPGTGGLAATPDGDTLFVATSIGLHRLLGASSGSVADGGVRVDQLGSFRRAADVHLDAHGRLWVASPILHGGPARLAISWDPLSDEPAFHDLASLDYVNAAIRPDSLAVLDDGQVVIADASVGLYAGRPSNVPLEPWLPPDIELLSLRQDDAPETPLEAVDPAVAPPLADPFVVYVAPDGDDAATGLREEESVGSLARAHAILVDRFGADAATLRSDVLVRVLSGTYVGQRVRWTFTHPRHVVRIAGHARGATATKPRFVGCGTPSCPSTQPWFLLQSDRGEASNVQLVNMTVSRYFRPLVLLGGGDVDRQWNGHNVAHRMHFHNIGTRYRSDVTPEVWSPGIVILRSSRFNRIVGNRFEASSNRMLHANPYFHVVYATRSSDNEVRGNVIVDTSGDFHIRDRSDRNVFAGNRIEASAIVAIVSDWNAPGESESCETEVSANVWLGDWECQISAVDWTRETRSSDGRCGRSGLRDVVVEVPNEHLPPADRCEPR